ncbi:unnamed protein product [Amoebophrya sp. A120]|nr:unnamed protein product [Amoebophrya sp. A120]|eukprot:GSA120T00019808001.1
MAKQSAGAVQWLHSGEPHAAKNPEQSQDVQPSNFLSNNFHWILGSASSSRRAFFEKFFGSTAFHAADIDEKAIRDPSPEILTQKLARTKAEKIIRDLTTDKDNNHKASRLFSQIEEGGVEIGATRPTALLTLDQVVRFRNEIREKPRDLAEARKFLESYKQYPDDWIECVNGFCVSVFIDVPGCSSSPSSSQKDETEADQKFLHEQQQNSTLLFRSRAHGYRWTSLHSSDISRVRRLPLSDEKINSLLALTDAKTLQPLILQSAGGFLLEEICRGGLGTDIEFSTLDEQYFGDPTLGIRGLPVRAIENLVRGFFSTTPVGTKITHVLFDMDGLLLNTEDIYKQATIQLCREKYNKEYTHRIREKMIGRRALPAAEIAVRELGLEDVLSPEQFIKERGELMDEKMKEADFLPGAKELLYRLQRFKIPLALATSSSRPLMMIKTTKVRAVFDEIFGSNIICGDELDGKGKPEPEIFQKALKMISRPGEEVSPANVLVFEDAPTGVDAALAAGMKVCMVPDVELSVGLRGKATMELRSLEHLDIEQLVT